MISCWNRGKKAFTIEKGDRIAQLVVIPVVQTQFVEVKNFTETNRGISGFGSSGKNQNKVMQYAAKMNELAPLTISSWQAKKISKLNQTIMEKLFK